MTSRSLVPRLPPSSTRRVPGVEGLRAAAACAVLVTHAWGAQGTIPGAAPVDVDGGIGIAFASLQLGVTLFFCLSGYLLYGPFAAWLVGDRPPPSVRAFARNRLLRIWPAYLVCAAGIVAFGLYRLGDGTVGYPPDLGRVARLFTMTTDVSPSIQGQGFPVAWTLPVELIFYASLPVLAALAARLRVLTRWQAALLPPVALLGLGLATRLALHHGPLSSSSWHWVVESSFLGQCDMFAWGMLTAVLAVGIRDHGVRLPLHWRKVAVPLAIVAVVLSAWRMRIDWQLTSSYANSVAAAAMGVLLAAVVLPHATARPQVVRALEWRPLVFVGIVSYSIYLWHSPVLDWMGEHGLVRPGVDGLAETIAVALAMTLVIASASYAFVEAPALRRKHVMSRRRTAGDLDRSPGTGRPDIPRPSRADDDAEPVTAARRGR